MGRKAFLLGLSVSSLFLLASCASAVRNLKIPLIEHPTTAPLVFPNILIEDMRPRKDRLPHLGNDISRCERWFGDETFTPSKITYLKKLVAERIPAASPVRIQLTRFAITEYCEHTAGGNASAAAAVANGSVPGFHEAPIIGDTVVVRLAGAINGIPFDESRRFDYGSLYTSPRAPSSYLTYRALLRDRLDSIADAIATKTPATAERRSE